MQKVLVLGVGNLLLRDEGVGIHAIRALLDDYFIPEGVEVIDGGTAGMELLSFLVGVHRVILLDAVKAGGLPGSLIRLEDEEIPTFFRRKWSPHQVGLADVLAVLKLTGERPCHITLWGIEPARMELGLELSESVFPQVSVLVERVVEELRKLGYLLKRKSKMWP